MFTPQLALRKPASFHLCRKMHDNLHVRIRCDTHRAGEKSLHPQIDEVRSGGFFPKTICASTSASAKPKTSNSSKSAGPAGWSKRSKTSSPISSSSSRKAKASRAPCPSTRPKPRSHSFCLVFCFVAAGGTCPDRVGSPAPFLFSPPCPLRSPCPLR